MYYQGQGVTQDFKEAVKWFRLSAEQGNADAQDILGVMYSNGQGVTKDYSRAYIWYSIAAAQGVTSAAKSRDYFVQTNETTTTRGGSGEGKKVCGIAFQGMRRDANQRNSIIFPRLRTHTKDRGTYVIPVLINNTITLEFTVDSGASDVSIPSDVVSTLIRSGTIEDSDFIGTKVYVLADGSKVRSRTFRIRSLKIGDRIFENVDGSIAPKEGALLLGQSLLGRFKSWSIDNTNHALRFE